MEDIDLQEELLKAARRGDIKQMKNMIEQGADVNLQYEEALTLMHYAVSEEEEAQTIIALHQVGADVNAKEK